MRGLDIALLHCFTQPPTLQILLTVISFLRGDLCRNTESCKSLTALLWTIATLKTLLTVMLFLRGEWSRIQSPAMASPYFLATHDLTNTPLDDAFTGGTLQVVLT
jgi:hypothetical protein